MLNDGDDDEILENAEVKTPSPLSSSADRSFNEDEDNPRGDTSSDESSPSDLRKRLQHLPSPNQAACLASRVIDISRRLSRQRDFYFQGKTNRIVENIEKEEAELDSPGESFARRSYSDLRAKDARTRRRAKIRLENARNRAMVVSNRSESVSSTRNDSSSQRSEGKSSSNESRTKECLDCEHRSVLEFDMSTSNADRQTLFSLSARSPGLYRDRRKKPCGDSQSQGSSMFLRPYSVAASSENSPRDRIGDGQSLSLPPSAKYRTCPGVILQNLSSGSEEAESSYEVTSDRRDVNQRIDRLMAATAREIGISLEVYETAKFQNDYLPPVSSRISSNRLVDSSRNACLENIVSSPSRMSFANVYPAHRANDPSIRFPSSKKNTPVYRTMTTARSENGCRNAKDMLINHEEEPMFYSAREEILQNYNRSRECSRTPNEMPILTIASPETGIREESPREVIQLDTSMYAETVDEQSYKGMPDERAMNESPEECSSEYPNEKCLTQCPNDYSGETTETTMFEDQTTLRSSQLPETIVEDPAFENAPENEVELDPSTITDSKALKQAISRCILTYDQDNETNFPPSDDIASSPEPLGDRYCMSEDTEMLSHNYYQSEYPDKSETCDEYSAEVTNDKEYVPALVLNSQEGSCCTSPTSKGYTEGLDTATLMVALSNASLKQQQTERISERNSESRASPGAYVDDKTISIPESASPSPRVDDKTVSRPESSENTISMEEHSRSFNEDPSCRSLSKKSKIPVKIPTHRSKLSIVSRDKPNETGRAGSSQGTSPIGSSKRSFKSSPSLPESFHFGSARVASGRVSKSRASSPLVQSYKIMQKPARSPVTNTSDVANEQESKSNRVSTKDETSTDRTESPAFSLQIRTMTSDDDRSRSEGNSTGKEENRDRGDSAKFHTDTCRSSNFSNSSGKHENVSQRSKQRSISSNSGSQSRSVEEPVADLAEPENYVEPTIYIPKTPESPVDSPLLTYRANYYGGYEGEIYEKIPDTRKTNLFENRIGDGSCNETQSSEERKFANSSPEKEEFAEKSVSENRDRLRFSLEKLAAEQFRRSIGKQTRSIRSDTAAFLADSCYECPQFSSSTSKLCYERSRDTSRFKKRSQDRFPFTISEKTSVASNKFKVPGQLSNLNEDRNEARGENEDEDEDEEDARYKLDVHPSITRLAGTGLEDSVADVIGHAAELEDHRETSGMKKLVQKFSARWNRSKRRDENEPSSKSANIIYRNRDYREECDSSVESCSESSLAKKLDMFNETDEKASTKRSIDSPDEISSIVCEQKSSIREIDVRETSPRSPSSGENPCRRYDRDDLWVQAFKELDSDREERNQENALRNDESVRSESKDPYSLFFVKSGEATPEISGREVSLEVTQEEMQNVPTETRKNRVKFRSVVAPKRLDEELNESENETARRESGKRSSKRVRKNRNLQSGCLCLRFYRMIVPISFGSISKYRSGMNRGSSSARNKTRASPNKRKG